MGIKPQAPFYTINILWFGKFRVRMFFFARCIKQQKLRHGRDNFQHAESHAEFPNFCTTFTRLIITSRRRRRHRTHCRELRIDIRCLELELREKHSAVHWATVKPLRALSFKRLTSDICGAAPWRTAMKHRYLNRYYTIKRANTSSWPIANSVWQTTHPQSNESNKVKNKNVSVFNCRSLTSLPVRLLFDYH